MTAAMATQRIIDVDLSVLQRKGDHPRVRAFAGSGSGAVAGAGSIARAVSEPMLERIASLGGSALGVALLYREAWSPAATSGEGVLVLAVGNAVGRRLPTAARLSILARAPLTGRLAEGHIGGDLGPHLAGFADALVLRGSTDLPGALLTVSCTGELELEARPELRGLSPAETWRSLDLADGAALLTIGRGGECGLPFASLASGGEHPSFVGRGGLGAVFGALGLKALVIERPRSSAASAAAGETQSARGLFAALSSSPRLAARAAGGSFELYSALGARDEAWSEHGRRLEKEAAESGIERKGCRGCPTPCGWLFERSDGTQQRARFNASRALGVDLGLEGFDDALELLEVCDELALDAKEVGAILWLLAAGREAGRLSGSSPRGNKSDLSSCIRALVEEPRGVADRLGARGAAQLARELDLLERLPESRGQAAPSGSPDRNYPGVLGQFVSTGGTDPMRSFPFLMEAGGRVGLERLAGDLGPLPAGAEDPGRPTAKGRLVYWHENLTAAVDASGFCAFSSAGLLADGLCDLDELAGWILPAALRAPSDPAWRALAPGRRLLAAGANVVLLRQELDRRWAAGEREASERLPAWAAERLGERGMLEEYWSFRGGPERAAELGTPGVLAPPAVAGSEEEAVGASGGDGELMPGGSRGTEASTQTRVAVVELVAGGPLGAALGDGRLHLRTELPSSVRKVLRAAAAGDQRRSSLLFSAADGDPQPIPAVWRDGHLLGPETRVEAGDVLELVTVIAGG